ncbi:MAG: hypothetical protein KKF44_03870 [Nanoarchaeota archaeon]|nr:hypothetical protein [Nanoarchaeota archaeon]
MRRRIFYLLIGFVLAANFTFSGNYALSGYESTYLTIPLLGVAKYENTGVSGRLSIEIKQDGLDRITFGNSIDVVDKAKDSIVQAIQLAEKYVHKEDQKNSYYITLTFPAHRISGASADAAATVLTIALLKDYGLRKDATITGHFDSGYNLVDSKGLLNKLSAAKDSGIATFVVSDTYVEAFVRRIKKSEQNSLAASNEEYHMESLDLAPFAMQEYGIRLISAKNIDDALELLVE